MSSGIPIPDQAPTSRLMGVSCAAQAHQRCLLLSEANRHQNELFTGMLRHFIVAVTGASITSKGQSIPTHRWCSLLRYCLPNPGSRSPSKAHKGERGCSALRSRSTSAPSASRWPTCSRPAGFDPRRDIAGIILNRWGHAYVNPQPGFFFGKNGNPAPRDILRNQPHGRIAFANTDLAGASDHRNSIREADRAVQQLVGTEVSWSFIRAGLLARSETTPPLRRRCQWLARHAHRSVQDVRR